MIDRKLSKSLNEVSRFNILITFCFLIFVSLIPQTIFADTFIISDTEGSISKIEAFVKEGKLKWIETPKGRRLDFVKPNDSLVFLGDLSGPNWLDSSNPQNIFLRDVFLDLKARHGSRFDFVWGNHEANRFGFIRDNILIERGQHPEYSKWLVDKGIKDSVENRVTFWGTQTYGMNKEGIPLPIADYQKELSKSRGKPVSVKDAAEQFAADLRVGRPGEKHGKMLQLLSTGQESTYRSGYSMTHAPIASGAEGIVPLGKKLDGGATWLRDRNTLFFRPQLEMFIKAAQNGEVPSDLLSSIGDARWDAAAKAVVNDSASITYTERAKDGEQYRGVRPSVAERFANDAQSPSRGLLSGHKPAGNFATAHRQEVAGKPFFDVVVDTSRGPNGMYSTTTVLDNGDLEIRGMTQEGSQERWTIGPISDPLVGKFTEDGFHIKGVTGDGKLILEKYVGFSLEEKIVPKESIDPSKTSFSFEDPTRNSVRLKKGDALVKAIKAHGGTVLVSIEEASRIVGDRFVLDLRGASKWAAVDEAKAKEIRTQLMLMAERLDPKKIVIMTGGNRAGHPNAVENMVHDIFAGAEAKKKFDIVGFMKHDTAADEVDSAVKFVFRVGEGDNWDGPVQAAQKFVNERRGATVMWSGGGVLERAIDTPVAARMKNRMLMVQGFGGASENKAAQGIAVKSTEDILSELYKVDSIAFHTENISGKPLRVGVYTGSFDPPHRGHQKIVEEMKTRYSLDRVYVVPDKMTAYKPGMQSIADREAMVKLMFKNTPGVQILSGEQTGSGQLWDVLKAAQKENPGAKVFGMMGTDTFQWLEKEPKEHHVKGVSYLVNNRDPKVLLPSTLNDGSVIRVDLADEGISSTSIRNSILKGEKPNELSAAVYDYIKQKKMYETSVIKFILPDCGKAYSRLIK